jgi:translocation and assembly module TamB
VARAGAGTVTLAGEATLGEAPRARLTLVADKFQLLGRVDRRIVASGNARLQLDRDTLALDGKLGIDEGLFDFTRSDAPGLSDDVTVIRPQRAESAGASPATDSPAANRKVAVDLQVALGERLRLRGRGIDTGLRGTLRITSPGGRLAVNGSVQAADGTYAAYGQKLTIDRGVIAFNGPPENPRLDIEATRPNTDVRVGVLVSGTALNPRVRLFSEPEMAEVDKLSWLVLGRPSGGLGRTDTALLQRAAVALLAGEGEGGTDLLTKTIGLDEVSLRQTEDGDVRETVITLGKQLSRRWYVGYERGLNATTGTWQLIYRIAQRFTLRAQSGQDNSVDLIWTWRWQ